MNTNMLKTLATCFMIGSTIAYAQDSDSTKTDDLQEEIKIFKNYIPEISRVNKKNQQPLFLDSVYIKENLEYQVKKMVLKVDENNHILSAIDYKKPFVPSYSSYILLGYGTDKRPLAEFSWSNQKSTKSKYGLYLRHYSEDRKSESIHYSDRSDNKAMAYFDYMDNGISFKSNISYQRLVVNTENTDSLFLTPLNVYYNPNTVVLNGIDTIIAKDNKLNHQIISGDFAFEQQDPNKLVQKVNFNIQHGFNNNEASETIIDFGSKWNIPLGKQKITANLDFISADHESSIAKKDGRLTHFQFDPTFYGKEGKLSFQLGVNTYYLIHEMPESSGDIVSGTSQEDENFLVFPKIYLNYQLPEATTVYGGYNGDYSINTYNDAIRWSPFVTPSYSILPAPSSTATPMNIYLGITTKAVRKLDLNLHLSYKEVERFQNLTATFGTGLIIEQLYVHPITLDLSILNIEATGKYKLNEQASVLGSLKFNQYSDVPNTVNLAHLPKISMSVLPEYKLTENLKAYGELTFTSSQYAMLTTESEKIDGFTDLNLGLSFDATEKLNTSLQIRNILDNKIETNQGYITNGFNLFISARYKL